VQNFRHGKKCNFSYQKKALFISYSNSVLHIHYANFSNLIYCAGGLTQVIMLIQLRAQAALGNYAPLAQTADKFAKERNLQRTGAAARLIKSNLTLMNHRRDNAPYTRNFVGRRRLLTAK
jgi:hypothetical protein